MIFKAFNSRLTTNYRFYKTRFAPLPKLNKYFQLITNLEEKNYLENNFCVGVTYVAHKKQISGFWSEDRLLVEARFFLTCPDQH
jgi:hypothetical protein